MSSSRVEDRWYKTDRATGARVPTSRHGTGMRYLARYRDGSGKQHSKTFPEWQKRAAQDWLNMQTASLVRGDHVAPRDARITVEQWCQKWLDGYATRAPSTVRQARVHVNAIVEHSGATRLSDVKPYDVRAWTVKLQQRYAASTTYATYRRFAQIMGDAVHDGFVPRSPCSRRTSPGPAKQKTYVATTQQVWALYDAFPEPLRVVVLLGAFVGLRVSEAVALRTTDVDFMRGVVKPIVQNDEQPLKSATSRMHVPIPQDLALMLSAHVERYGGDTIVTDAFGRPVQKHTIERAMRAAREQIDGLPSTFVFHDLRHYFASLLIASGVDVKTVQARMRHASASTTLNVYGHMFPDNDESTRSAVSAALRADSRVPGAANCAPVVHHG